MMEFLETMENNQKNIKDKKIYGLKSDHFFYLIAVLMVPISALLVRYNAMDTLSLLSVKEFHLFVLSIISSNLSLSINSVTGIPPTVVYLGNGTIVSPCPPIKTACISFGETFNSKAKNER